MPASQSTNGLSTVLPNAGGSFAVQEDEIGPNQIGTSAVKLGFLQVVLVTLTAAQVNGMYAAPVLIAAAPTVVGQSLIPGQSMIRVLPTATQFASGGVVAVQIGNTVHGGGTLFTATLAAAVVNGAVQVDTLMGPVNTNVTLVPFTGSNAAAAGLYLSNATGAFTTGTGTVVVMQEYRVD